ncbi:MAG: hypothetical protein ACFFD4_17495 [Candidatus Odinarchaeota archaeon]
MSRKYLTLLALSVLVILFAGGILFFEIFSGSNRTPASSSTGSDPFGEMLIAVAILFILMINVLILIIRKYYR